VAASNLKLEHRKYIVYFLSLELGPGIEHLENVILVVVHDHVPWHSQKAGMMHRCHSVLELAEDINWQISSCERIRGEVVNDKRSEDVDYSRYANRESPGDFKILGLTPNYFSCRFGGTSFERCQ
jgi:hypothetical protein